jgi:hypothetical protein
LKFSGHPVIVAIHSLGKYQITMVEYQSIKLYFSTNPMKPIRIPALSRIWTSFRGSGTFPVLVSMILLRSQG